MNLAHITKSIRSGVHFFGATSVVWFAFLFVVEDQLHVENEFKLLAALLAGVASYLLLRELGYFSTLRMHPRKSDLLLVLLVTPLGGLLLYAMLHYLYGAPANFWQEFVLWSPVLALAIFALEYFGAGAFADSYRKRKVVLDLLPAERDNLLEDFDALELERGFEFLNRNDLRKHLLSARAEEISLIIISRNAVCNFDADAVLLRAHLAGVPIVDHHTISADLTGRIRLNDPDQWTYILAATRQTSFLRAFSRFKVMVEPLAAVCLGVLLLPLIGLLAALIKLTSVGPILYFQTRTGYLGKTFTLLKFRSMNRDAEPEGPQWSSEDDDRVTLLGAFMRKTRLDELPQLWNVMKGEMSFCGPRPERPEMYKRLEKEIPLFRIRTVVRPGITGWAQVCAGYAASVEESFQKLEFDLYYIKHMSPRLDAIIFMKTVALFLFGSKAEKRRSGADAGRSEAADSVNS